MHRRLLVLFLLCYGSNGFSSIDEAVTICEECTQEMAALAALKLAEPNAAIGVYVADYKSETIRRFRVGTFKVDESVISESSPIDVESEVQRVFDRWLTVKYLPVKSVLLAPDVVGCKSSNDFMEKPKCKRELAAFLRKKLVEELGFPEGILTDELTPLAYMSAGYFNTTNQVRIFVGFEDGTTHEYRMEFPNYINKTDVRFVRVDGDVDSNNKILYRLCADNQCEPARIQN